jgi:hypothetical protein
MNPQPGKDRTIWHVTLDLVYEAPHEDSCQAGVKRIREALRPLFENGSGIKQLYFTGLPERDPNLQS